VGLSLPVSCFSVVLLGISVGSVSAAPKLRLSTTAIGPLTVATGANVPSSSALRLEATNAGDGSLSLSYKSNAAWLTAASGSSSNCVTAVGCTPVVLTLATASLSKGVYTGVLTVSDSNAVDAPQTVTVTVQVGGGVPDSMTLYAAPGAYADQTFNLGTKIGYSVQSSQGFLSVLEDGAGSFVFYRVRARALDGMAEGSYNGSFTLSGAPVAADNKTVPVSFRITSQPIASPSSASLQFRIAQGTPKQVQNVVLSNLGLGTLAVSGVTASTASGGSWLSGAVGNGFAGAAVTADAGSTSPGVYQGTVTLATNSVQGNVVIPVQFEVVAAGAPLITYQGITNNADFVRGDTIGQGAFANLFGEQFVTGDPVTAQTLPYTGTLNNVQVFVNDKPAPVQYTSYGQINFQMPYDATLGAGVVRVERSGQRSNSISVNIAARAPRLFVYGDYVIASHSADYSLVLPASIGFVPAKRGETVILWAVGLGQTVPAVQTGVAPPSVQVVPAPRVILGSGPFTAANIQPAYAGLAGYPGLYQINFTIPDDAPTGDNVMIYIAWDDVTSNRANIAIR
jgi:uncharacterized protein (TIGR03437 family)